jgi:hypothetical protein
MQGFFGKIVKQVSSSKEDYKKWSEQRDVEQQIQESRKLEQFYYE